MYSVSSHQTHSVRFAHDSLTNRPYFERIVHVILNSRIENIPHVPILYSLSRYRAPGKVQGRNAWVRWPCPR